MTALPPRVAYFPDSFHEVNGVAHTSRHFESYAQRRNLPFLCIRAGNRPSRFEERGNCWSLELPRGSLAIPLEKDLSFDPVYVRHLPLIMETLVRFRPTLIHITGPSELGLLGAVLAHRYCIPLAASWHTNVHEYAARRFSNLARVLPKRQGEVVERSIEQCALSIAAKLYSSARILFAPNPELCGILERKTGRPCRLMPRGVDPSLFDPQKRTRREHGGQVVLGYVGRLSVEKNVRVLAQVQRELEASGRLRFKFVFVGQGSEEAWLRRNLPRAEFKGVLRGEALADAYANMDLFVFPSRTDTFGNVVLEALASGVPAIVTPQGGPASIIKNGETGSIVPDAEFAQTIDSIMANCARFNGMRSSARKYALAASWDSVFDGVYAGYDSALPAIRRGATKLLRTQMLK